MSGGTEGGLSPHFLILARREGPAAPERKALAIGTAFTHAFRPEEIGRMSQVEATAAAAVGRAMAEAGLTDPADVHLVQVKCPLLTSARIADAAARGHGVATHDTYASMGLSRGASALGIALALGEVDREQLTDPASAPARSLFRRASASAGIELMRNEIIVLGNAQAGPARSPSPTGSWTTVSTCPRYWGSSATSASRKRGRCRVRSRSA